MKKYKNVFEEARGIYKETIEIPKLYIDALFMAQFFEYTLAELLKEYIYYAKLHLELKNIPYELKIDEDWTYKELIARLKNFIPPNKNLSFYELMANSSKKRNIFIHSAFKKKTDEGYVITGGNNYHLSSEAQLCASEWLSVGEKAIRALLDRSKTLLLDQVHQRRVK